MISLALPAFVFTAQAEESEATNEVYTTQMEVTTEVEAVDELQEERIPNPESIKNYRQIRKDGTALYGIPVNRMNNNNRPTQDKARPNNESDNKKTKVKNETKNEAKDEAELEKILTLDDVKYFTKIRKIGTSLFGIRINSTATNNSTLSAEAITCVKTALTTKQSAITSAYDSYTSSIKTAMTTRMSAQLTALDITNNTERIKAMKLALTTNKKAREDAMKLHKTSVKKANNDYKTALKACRVSLTPELDSSDIDSAL